jgi:CRP-like cAMP-binding protein
VTFFDYPVGGAEPVPTGRVFLPTATERDWSDLLTLATVRRLEAGETLVESDAGAGSLFLILDGQFELLVPAGRKWRRIGTVGPGSITGEVTFFDGGGRLTLVRALAASSAAELTAAGFDALGRTRPDLAVAVAMEVGRILAQTVRQGPTG